MIDLKNNDMDFTIITNSEGDTIILSFNDCSEIIATYIYKMINDGDTLDARNEHRLELLNSLRNLGINNETISNIAPQIDEIINSGLAVYNNDGSIDVAASLDSIGINSIKELFSNEEAITEYTIINKEFGIAKTDTDTLRLLIFIGCAILIANIWNLKSNKKQISKARLKK